METALLDTTSIKIRGKQGSFVVDPTKKSKTTADAIILLSSQSDADAPTELRKESRVTIAGPGSYEVSGTKINGTKYDSDTFYKFSIDSMDVLLAKADGLEKAHGKLDEINVLICQCNSVASPASILSLAPRVGIFYGEHTAETIKGLGKDSVQSTSKYTITAEKLPLEMEVVLLK